MEHVTAFVTTIGSQTFGACIAALRAQTEPLRIDVIDHVAPWSAAQNEMLRRCETRLFVQVDEDMILAPTAIADLVALIDGAAPTCVMATAPLWDVDLEMAIYGIKVYRHELARRVPFETHVLGDGHDRARWAEAGLTWERSRRTRENCVGQHGTDYTPEQAFGRWRGMWQRHRATSKAEWIEPWLDKLAQRYRASGSLRDLYAFIGAITGAIEEPWPDDAGPDFSRPNPVLDRLRALRLTDSAP